jgi:hypothetical protein
VFLRSSMVTSSLVSGFSSFTSFPSAISLFPTKHANHTKRLGMEDEECGRVGETSVERGQRAEGQNLALRSWLSALGLKNRPYASITILHPLSSILDFFRVISVFRGHG